MNNDLRTAAEAATPGPWNTHLVDDTCVVADSVDVATTCDSSNVERSDSYNNDFERMEADAAYIAAANPQAILALLDERDALTARVAELERRETKLMELLTPPKIDTSTMVNIGSVLDAEYVCGSRVVHKALAELLNWYDRAAAAMEVKP